jgi:hypothetical protein
MVFSPKVVAPIGIAPTLYSDYAYHLCIGLRSGCGKCMQQGCCEQIPALSGTEEDNAEDEDDAPSQQSPSK